MSWYARRNKKVCSYCVPKEFFDFYGRTSIGSRMVKSDEELYYLDDNGFRKLDNNDIVVFNKNKSYWSEEDIHVIPKSEFDSEYAIVKSMSNIDRFLIEFSSHMGIDSMVKVFKKMLEELNNEHSSKNTNLKNQLQWIVNNQDVFLYMLS